ncbi:MAG TPA: tetratricopeptide repeat protein [Rhizomicrobium sp.]|jgi:tetratricopeptide (TPR) repeat protein
MGKFTWIGMIAAASMAPPAWSAPVTEALIAEAQAALDRGDAQHAASLANDALKEDGISPDERGRLYLYRGLAEELLGSHDPAMRDFTAALDGSALPVEEREQALLQRGFLRDGLGRLDEAARDYTAVVALKGDNLSTALNNRANIYRRQNRFTQARRDYREALSVQGCKPQYSWYGLGQIAEAEADTLSARGFYAKAVAADPDYALASERLEALGGAPKGAIPDPEDRIVLRPPQSLSAAKVQAQDAKETDGRSAMRAPDSVPPLAVLPIALHPPRRKAPGLFQQAAETLPAYKSSAADVVLRPALDQPRRPIHLSASIQEVQLGAWRSEGEANAGWDKAKLRAGEALSGLSPHIVTADLPGKGRYYRLRVAVTVGQSRSAFCADLSAKGVDCLPARD